MWKATLNAADAEDWGEWLAEAHGVIQTWEAETDAPLLSVREAAALSERIAKALQRAFERGRAA